MCYCSIVLVSCRQNYVLYRNSQVCPDSKPTKNNRWQSSMNEQIQKLPNFDQVEREVMRFLKKLKL